MVQCMGQCRAVRSAESGRPSQLPEQLPQLRPVASWTVCQRSAFVGLYFLHQLDGALDPRLDRSKRPTTQMKRHLEMMGVRDAARPGPSQRAEWYRPVNKVIWT